jgi:hypothetical protein
MPLGVAFPLFEVTTNDNATYDFASCVNFYIEIAMHLSLRKILDQTLPTSRRVL